MHERKCHISPLGSAYCPSAFCFSSQESCSLYAAAKAFPTDLRIRVQIINSYVGTLQMTNDSYKNPIYIENSRLGALNTVIMTDGYRIFEAIINLTCQL